MRTRTKLALFLALAAALSAGSLLGGTLAGGGGRPAGSESAPVSADVAAEAALGGYGTGDAADTAALERRVGAAPQDVQALTLLGYAYLQRWRETADASFLPRAGEALGRARRLAPADPLVVTGLGSLALTQHEFRRALRLGGEARRLAPYSARPLGIVGDALLELGRYEEAFRAFERMNELKPNLASYARIAYARELLGDLDGAASAMRLAVDAASAQREPAAWARVELAKLLLARGRTAAAEQELRGALTLQPGYVFAEEQLARAEAARGRIGRAVARARRAAESVPLPQLVALHGELLQRAGRPLQARRELATVGAIDRLLAAGGIRTDLESALFQADHLVRPAGLVDRARAARAARPTVYGDDTLAWALARSGRCEEALPWAQRSLRLGTQDALLFFHRAWIEDCRGRTGEARTWAQRALELNPHFSVRWEPVARRLAA